MKQVVPVKKNDEVIINITGQGIQGEGVGKIDGFTIFVDGAISSEVVKAKIVKVNKNFAFARLMDIVEPSVNRAEPKCSIYKNCGGCQIQHFSYELQLKYKKQRVLDCMKRIGNLNEKTIIHDTLGMENPSRYRNKVQLPVRGVNGDISIGFYSIRSHDVVNLDTCYIQDEVADKVIQIVRAWLKKFSISVYNEQTNTGIVRHIMVRKGFKTGQVMVVIVTNGERFPRKQEFIKDIISGVEGVSSIIQNVNPECTNVILGSKCITVWGSHSITEYIGKYHFNISALSFFQINPLQTKVLYEKVLEYAKLSGSETVFDIYCGAGTISLFISEFCKKVYGVEIVPEAIDDAKINAKENDVINTEFVNGEAEKVIPELIERGINADVVIVDPPRKGCDIKVLEAIAQMKPEKIVYVSCDPATLARDLNILETLGYNTVEIQPVDMFPQTGHVENVAKLVKKDICD